MLPEENGMNSKSLLKFIFPHPERRLPSAEKTINLVDCEGLPCHSPAVFSVCR